MFRKMQISRWTFLTLVVVLVIAAAISFTGVNAQDMPEQTINFGDVMLGEINLSRIQSLYRFEGNAGETIYLRAQSLTPDFSLAYRLTDAAGTVLAQGMHTNGRPASLTMISLPETDEFTISIQSGNGVAGQYTLSLENLPQAEMRSLATGEIVRAAIRAGEAPQAYLFNIEAGTPTFLMVDSPMGVDGPSFTVEDAAAAQTIAAFRLNVTGACLRIAPSQNNYTMTVIPGISAQAQPFHVMLWEVDSSDVSCPYSMFTESETAPTEDLALNASAVCLADAGAVMAVNVRADPTTRSTVIAHIMPGTSAPLVARSADGIWLMVNLNGTVGWVAAPVVSQSGDCSKLTVMNVQTGPVTTTASSGSQETGSGGDTSGGGDGYLICVNGDPNNLPGGAELCGELVDTVNGALDDPVGTVNDVVDGVGDVVNNAADTVNDTVNDAVDTINDTVNNAGGGLPSLPNPLGG